MRTGPAIFIALGFLFLFGGQIFATLILFGLAYAVQKYDGPEETS